MDRYEATQAADPSSMHSGPSHDYQPERQEEDGGVDEHVTTNNPGPSDASAALQLTALQGHAPPSAPVIITQQLPRLGLLLEPCNPAIQEEEDIILEYYDTFSPRGNGNPQPSQTYRGFTPSPPEHPVWHWSGSSGSSMVTQPSHPSWDAPEGAHLSTQGSSAQSDPASGSRLPRARDTQAWVEGHAQPYSPDAQYAHHCSCLACCRRGSWPLWGLSEPPAVPRPLVFDNGEPYTPLDVPVPTPQPLSFRLSTEARLRHLRQKLLDKLR